MKGELYANLLEVGVNRDTFVDEGFFLGLGKITGVVAVSKDYLGSFSTVMSVLVLFIAFYLLNYIINVTIYLLYFVKSSSLSVCNVKYIFINHNVVPLISV